MGYRKLLWPTVIGLFNVPFFFIWMSVFLFIPPAYASRCLFLSDACNSGAVPTLHASFRTPNLKARLNSFREEFRAVWRGYSDA